MFISLDMGNDHLGFAWHLLRSSQEIYTLSTYIREQFDPTLLEGIQKPPCKEVILWDPNFGENHHLHNNLRKSRLLRGHEQYMRAENHYTHSQHQGREFTGPSKNWYNFHKILCKSQQFCIGSHYHVHKSPNLWAPYALLHFVANYIRNFY
jgi:hypothetical protein